MEKKNATRNNPCPICGKPDWCLQVEGQNGTLWECHRLITEPLVSGTDGLTYVYCGQSKSGQCSRYEEQGQHEAWLAKHKGMRYTFKGQQVKTAQYVEEDMNEVADPVQLDAVYRGLLLHLRLSEEDAAKMKADGWSTELLEEHCIKTLPPPDYIRRKQKQKDVLTPTRNLICKKLMKEFGDDCLYGVPGFYIQSSRDGKLEWWDINGKGGIVFPVYDVNGYLIRLRIRVHYTEEDYDWYEDKGVKPPKYLNLTSYKEDRDDINLIIRNKLKEGTRSSSKCSLYVRPTDSYSTVAVTEGEKKGIIINDVMHIPAVSLPGVTSYSKLVDANEGDGVKSIAQHLKERGCKTIYLLYDADKAKNKMVLQSEEKTVKTLMDMGFRLTVGEWSENLGKGIDDLLMNGMRPQVVEVFDSGVEQPEKKQEKEKLQLLSKEGDKNLVVAVSVGEACKVINEVMKVSCVRVNTSLRELSSPDVWDGRKPLLQHLSSIGCKVLYILCSPDVNVNRQLALEIGDGKKYGIRLAVGGWPDSTGNICKLLKEGKKPSWAEV